MERNGGNVDLTSATGAMASGSPEASRPTLREVSREQARSRIIQGSMTALAASGLDATVDEVAQAAGVSRRTVFRHFANQGELILATLIEVRRKLDEGMPGPPPPGADLETWLTESVVKAHELFRTLIGRFFWDLYTERHHISPEVTARISGAMALRQHYAKLFADAAWRAIGGEGEAPIWVRDSFALHSSGFATNAFPAYSAEETGQLCARLLWLTLTTALNEQRQELAEARSKGSVTTDRAQE